MKKLLCILIATLLLLCALTACANNDNKDGDASKESGTATSGSETTGASTGAGTGDTTGSGGETGGTPNESISLANYVYEKLKFSYPADYVLTEGETVSFTDAASGSRIDVYSQEKTNIYDDMTLNEYLFSMESVNEITGTKLSDVSLERASNANGVRALIITQKATTDSFTEYQTKYIFTAGDLTYTVTLGQKTNSTILHSIVFNSFEIVK